MAEFYPCRLTQAGTELYAKVQTGSLLTFTRARVGDGYIEQDPTDMAHPVQDLEITGIEIVDNGFVRFDFIIDNIQKGFWFRELGIFAEDPDVGEILYAFSYPKEIPLPGGSTTPGADWVPPIGSSSPYKPRFNVYARIGNATNVTAYISDSNFITMEDLNVRMPVISVERPSQIPGAIWGQIIQSRPQPGSELMEHDVQFQHKRDDEQYDSVNPLGSFVGSDGKKYWFRWGLGPSGGLRFIYWEAAA